MSLARFMAKGIRGAADFGAKASYEQLKADVMRIRDENLHRLEMIEQDDTQKHESTLQESRIGAQMADSEADRQQRQPQIDAATEASRASTESTRQRIDIGQFDLEKARQLQNALGEMINAETEEQRDQAHSLYLRLRGEPGSSRYQGMTLYSQGLDEYDEPAEIRSSGVLDRWTGQMLPASTPGVTAPRAAIELLRSNPTENVKAQFDQKYGEGAAERILGR